MASPASYCTANGTRVHRAMIVRALRGAWYADLKVDSTVAPKRGDAVTVLITSETGAAVTLVGTYANADVFVDQLVARVVGGHGGLGRELGSKWYLDSPVSLPLADVLTETGEMLSTTSSAAATSVQLRTFPRVKSAASSVLDVLAEAAGATWRVLEDGTIFVGADTFPDGGVTTYDLVGASPDDDRVDVAVSLPAIRPGTLFRSRKVVHVIDTIEASSVRTNVYYGR